MIIPNSQPLHFIDGSRIHPVIAWWIDETKLDAKPVPITPNGLIRERPQNWQLILSGHGLVG